MDVKLKKFRNIIIGLALVSFFSYPLLEIILDVIDTSTGKRSTANGGFVLVYFHPVSEPTIYLFVYGVTAAVMMSFIYLAIKIWNKKHSKGYVALISLLGIIATLISFMAIIVSFIALSGVIHESFPT